VAIIALAAATVAIFYRVNDARSTAQRVRTDTDWSLIARAVSPSDHTLGDLAAPVQVIVYSSIACPFCRTFFETQAPKLKEAFGDRLVIAYRHNPIPAVPNAAVQEPAAECVYNAGGNEAFWQFVWALFPHAGEASATDPEYLASVAVTAGVSKDAFLSCMRIGGGDARVAADKREAAIGGLTVDPSFLIKSAHRAIVIKRDYYSQIYASIEYLLNIEEQEAGATVGS
jgi:protein-disulfide isomerase